MSTILFPEKPRREDPQAAMVVQRNLNFLRDQLEDLIKESEGGSATVTVGNTSVSVTLTQTYAAYSVVISPTKDPGVRYWVSNKATTTFQINLQSAAPAGGISFDYIVKGV